MLKKFDVHYFDTQDLMATMLGKYKEYDNGEIEDRELENQFYEEFDVNFEQFHKLVEHLVPHTVITDSPLTRIKRVGFVNHEAELYIVKVDL
jgi:adenosine deaminase